MSIQAMAWVINHSKARGNLLLMLLMIASHTQKDGTGARPSIATLAKRCRMSERTIQYLLAEASESLQDELVIHYRAGFHQTHVYDILMTEPATREATAPVQPVAPVQTEAFPVQPPPFPVQHGAPNTSVDTSVLRPDPPGRSVKASEWVEEKKLGKKTLAELTEIFDDVFAIPARAPLKAQPLKPDASFPPPKPVLTPQQDMFGALCAVTKMDMGLTNHVIGPAAAKLLKRGYTPAQVREHYADGSTWYKKDWRGQKGQSPRINGINETINEYTAYGDGNGNGNGNRKPKDFRADAEKHWRGFLPEGQDRLMQKYGTQAKVLEAIAANLRRDAEERSKAP